MTITGDLQDTDKMPFGKHKGVAMANVPASYLLWLYQEKKASKEVMRYIHENLDCLKMEVQRNGR